MSIHKTIDNVEELCNRYGNRITTTKQLLIAYWKVYDGVSMNKGSISIDDFLSKATEPDKIINAYRAYKILKERDE